MPDAPQLNAAAFEGAMFAFIREVVITAGKPGLIERVDAGGIDEARKYMAKNPNAVREVSASIRGYLDSLSHQERLRLSRQLLYWDVPGRGR